MKYIPIMMAAIALAGCKTDGTQPVKSVSQIVKVPVRMPCPTKDELAALRAKRPVELSQTTMPASLIERVAKMAAQIGAYEAEGGHNDRVDAILNRCSD